MLRNLLVWLDELPVANTTKHPLLCDIEPILFGFQIHQNSDNLLEQNGEFMVVACNLDVETLQMANKPVF